MRDKNRKRALLISCAVILLCLVPIVGMTFALFTDTAVVKNHLQAGDLSITLKRTELQKTALNEKGYLTALSPDRTIVDFSRPTDENIFGIAADRWGNTTEKIVPGTSFASTLCIENNSDVAFGFWLRIECKDPEAKEALAKQLKIAVYTDQNGDGVIDPATERKEGTVAGGLEVGSDREYVSVLGIGDKQTFTVEVCFDDQGYHYENGTLTSNNDSAQAGSVAFDLVVYAIQVTTPPTP